MFSESDRAASSRGNPYRALPGVDEIFEQIKARAPFNESPREVLIAVIRDDLEKSRELIRDESAKADEIREQYTTLEMIPRLTRRLSTRLQSSYIGAINATGVVLHTGLGRAVLAKSAREAVLDAAGFTVLELERKTGHRNRREDGISALLRELTGAPAATVVNNNAGATLIALAALARGREVIVARGQLVEIGGSYRIPDVMAESGCLMKEIGTTNKVRISDYEKAINPQTALLLRVHTSNYKIVGFTAEVGTSELVKLARKHDLMVMDDLGSGALFDLSPFGLPHEPLVKDSLDAGAAVVTFSGDKLLGGPQAGLIVGLEESIEKISKHPLYRALRPDKLTLAALEATLQLYRDLSLAQREIPVLRMLTSPASDYQNRGEAILKELQGLAAEVELLPCESMVGGGAYAVEKLPSLAISLRPAEQSLEEFSKNLRMQSPPVFARIKDDRLWLDLRTIQPEQDQALISSVQNALRGGAEP